MRMLVWGAVEQTQLVLSTIAWSRQIGPKLTVALAGSPTASRSAEFANSLAAVLREQGLAAGDDRGVITPVTDLRTALRSAEVDVVLLASPGDFCDGEHDADDRAALAAARAGGKGARVFSFEPMPASLLQLETPKLTVAGEDDPRAASLLAQAGVVLGHGTHEATGGSGGAGATNDEARADDVKVPDRSGLGSAGGVQTTGRAALLETLGGWAAFCPCARVSRVVREAVELIEHVGPVRAMSVESLGRPEHGSLGARVFDAMDLVASFMGVAETVDGAYAPVARSRGVHSVPSQRLRALDGSLTAHARFADGRSASIVASNRAGSWSRRLVMICDSGRAVVDDRGVQWIGSTEGHTHDGGRADHAASVPSMQHARPGSLEIEGVEPGAAAVAEALARALNPRAGGGGASVMPTDYPAVLALCGAALLSARTGEAESPATILRMARGG